VVGGGGTIAVVTAATDDRPIGMFDSGFGGLTVARAAMDLLPAESLVYLGDTGRYPYGPRSLDEVRGFAHQICAELVFRRDVKAIVVACNTAAAAALASLRSSFDVPIIGVIEPGVRALVQATERGRIGVIGTVGTINSGAYQRELADEGEVMDLTALACPGFVEFVERGETGSEQVHVLAQRLLAPAVEAGIDALLLGCTHYPYLARTIADVMGRDVVLVSSADETAFELRSLIESHAVAACGDNGARTTIFLTTGDVEWFTDLGGRLLGPELADAEAVRLV